MRSAALSGSAPSGGRCSDNTDTRVSISIVTPLIAIACAIFTRIAMSISIRLHRYRSPDLLSILTTAQLSLSHRLPHEIQIIPHHGDIDIDSSPSIGHRVMRGRFLFTLLLSNTICMQIPEIHTFMQTLFQLLKVHTGAGKATLAGCLRRRLA